MSIKFIYVPNVLSHHEISPKEIFKATFYNHNEIKLKINNTRNN